MTTLLQTTGCSPLFQSQHDNSGASGLLCMFGVLAAWIAIGTVMWGAYIGPQVRQVERCEVVCRQTQAEHSKG